MSKNKQLGNGFKELLESVMRKRWFITFLVLLVFILIIAGIFAAVIVNLSITGEWRELLLLLLGAFIGSFGKIIDYWFSDTDKDKLMVQKMDEEDGVALSNAIPPSNSIDSEKKNELTEVTLSTDNIESEKTGVLIDENKDGTPDGLDFNNDGQIDEYFSHRQCDHVWGDSDGDGELECLICGKIKDLDIYDTEG